MKRDISYTEQSTLLTCQAQWDFNYGGFLAGDALRSRKTPMILREGRAWGRAVAAFHAAKEDRLDAAILVLSEALEEDAKEQNEAGFYDADAHRLTVAKLRAVLEQYAEETTPLTLDRLEHELFVPLPSRSGSGDSNRYRLQVLFDGVHTDSEGRVWLVEFKLRGELSSLELIANSRQIRYYAWAWERETGQPVTGVIVDERLNAMPKPPKIKNGKKGEGREEEIEVEVKDKETGEVTGTKPKTVWRMPSTDKAQITTPELYVAACAEYGVEPDAEMVESLGTRAWSQRRDVFLTPTEIEESGKELVSLGRQIAAIDSGQIFPVRNVKPQNCRGCRFREICNEPNDKDLVDSLFERRPAKRNREEQSPA
jgi:CRISPR/Cas system-associated exonuclease Cas4 (RecB family)